MDQFLALVGAQAVKYAIRSGIALTSTYALRQCSTLLNSVEDKRLQKEMEELQKVLEDKIKIITPAIDLIELKSGRGNNVLESASTLTKSINRDILRLGRRIESAMAPCATTPDANSHEATEEILNQMKSLLSRIDSNIPLLQLVISTSGESLSTSLPSSISPSRILQASTFLTIGDTRFAANPTQSVQIGPEYLLSVYMLFSGHLFPVDGSLSASPTPKWKEVVHKGRVQLYRVPSPTSKSLPHHIRDIRDGSGFTYKLDIIEDQDDGRLHDLLDSHGNDSRESTIAESVPICEITKTFYASSGKILNLNEDIDGANTPVLLLKREANAHLSRDDNDGCEPRGYAHQDEDQKFIDQQISEESHDRHSTTISSVHVPPVSCDNKLFPLSVDRDWIALEIFEPSMDDESETSSENDAKDPEIGSTEEQRCSSSPNPLENSLTDEIRAIYIANQAQRANNHVSRRSSEYSKPEQSPSDTRPNSSVAQSPFNTVTTSLSLLEMTIRLAGLQEFQQTSHLSIPDHILTFFLEESSTTGFSDERKWAAAAEAASRVGFDPYSDTAGAQNRNGIA